MPKDITHRSVTLLLCFGSLPLWAACREPQPGSRPALRTKPDAGAEVVVVSAMGHGIGTGDGARETGGWGDHTGSNTRHDASVPAPTPLPTLALSPDRSSVTLPFRETQPPIAFSATLSNGSALHTPAHWSSDPKELGTIDRATGAFRPSGAAGVVSIRASALSLSATTTLDITVSARQEGDPDRGVKPAGPGGLGGVGGEGGGTPITNPALRAALDKPATVDAELSWLYPYDGTVWPRALPAPLLQWRHGSHVPLAIKLHLEVDKGFRYDGYFGPPQPLAAGQGFDHLPFPQQVWRQALQSGARMKVSLSIAASDGAGGYVAFTTAKNLSWTIAPAALKGVVYYNSYGTRLAENATDGKGGRFGGATLAIQGDAYDPTLVAGSTTTDDSGCRVCHVVSADGTRLLVQQTDNMASSSYDLRNLSNESMYTAADRGKFGWAALSPDGSVALGNAGPPGTNLINMASLTTSALYRVSDGQALPVDGLSTFVTQAATPVFSPDGRKIAFNFYAGPGTDSIHADGHSLVVMDFSKRADDRYVVSSPRQVFTATGGDERPAWPFFLPDGSGLVFELEKKPNTLHELFITRLGARGELWWTDLNGHAHALDQANGKGYLPSGPLGHEDDTTLQYEPAVAPILAGGYAWVVFTSRRLYGNVATRGPYESDPRGFDLSPGNASGPTTKKLWVAAIDIPPKPGTDPSHPAFYLPAQELFAGNSRGYWVLSACQQNGKPCAAGDECCGGYCRVLSEFSDPVCIDQPPSSCAHEHDGCNLDADCCQVSDKMLSCIAGHCAHVMLL